MAKWTDLTVVDAGSLKEFYAKVFGWTVQEIAMSDENGTYADYAMIDKTGEAVGGVCHKRGANADIPSQWMSYFTVDNLKESIDTAIAMGAKLLKENKNEKGEAFFAILEDPSGAVVGIMQEGAY